MVIEKFPYIFKKFVKSSVALVKRNQISEWAVIFRYENFFIPRVENSSKISPWDKNLASRGPTALGQIFEDFSTHNLSYLKITAHSEIVFLYELTKRICAPI